jgi:hypothetical protein
LYRTSVEGVNGGLEVGDVLDDPAVLSGARGELPNLHDLRQFGGQIVGQWANLDIGLMLFACLRSVQTKQAHAAVLGRDQRQAKPGVFNSQAARDAFEGALRACEEFVIGGPWTKAFLFQSCARIVLNSRTAQVSDLAMRDGGLLSLFQTAQRSASGEGGFCELPSPCCGGAAIVAARLAL